MRFFATLLISLAAGAYASPHALSEERSAGLETRATVPEHFQCKEDRDCVERNVGNCCGYYPMCANSEAVLPHPCPSGGFGVCGWPVIDQCKCGSKGGCMSLQSGNIVHGSEWE
ncbi:hypothetical protein SODALDRAFT_353536 [Sodiomyces alkalinus F11]|uniref:Uncharacterized protein n=1 Tax=Sodiomyces alkalinus (strain CBS 110278 / VKM F-3762 / F11) TaxID=1314773 RepID=A0A3N2PKY6_SODAK|nr:hypothetical protein SODALDRAFT_353536 [Sodiomyces alkalinus F11]ROT35159.1 hypothetical protein SODALDRAFT_353536 [Sodiomyces alkalinus F11]